MDDEFSKIKDELIFKAGYFAENMGLNKSMGQLYAALYFADKKIPLEELAKMSRMSKGNASINIRRLERWGAVNKVWVNENRKDYYEANKDIIGFSVGHGMRVFSNLLREGEEILDTVHSKINTFNSLNGGHAGKNGVNSCQKGIKELKGLVKKMKGLSNNFKLIEGIIKGAK